MKNSETEDEHAVGWGNFGQSEELEVHAQVSESIRLSTLIMLFVYTLKQSYMCIPVGDLACIKPR